MTTEDEIDIDLDSDDSPEPTDDPSAADTVSDNGFPVVGIGASAGGLAAFEAFFSGMPADRDPGMAFVLVQHLAPDHKSILTELIGRYTRMQVYEVEDGMVVRPNCAYIIPPGRDMAFVDGTLQLIEPTAPHGQRMPIDYFFRSLAQDQHERAICVVLSGTGSDGTVGVRAIKGEGGMAIAQNPASTEFDGMPRSAIATGLVDYELPPAEMPAQIMAYVEHIFGTPLQPAARTLPRSENATKKVLLLVRDQTGHDFAQYKSGTIRRRIERRMALHQIATLEQYASYAQQTPAEIDALFRDLLIGVTSFFRNPEAFKLIAEQVMPQLVDAKPANGVIRIWTPGCSTGEEAYSLAILVAEHQQAFKQPYWVQIFATDIDAQAIATARAGLYPASITTDVSPERLARHFSLEADGVTYRINKNIRDMLIFSEQDLIKDPPFSRLDLISCRNLLIYLDAELQKRLIPLFHYALNPGGFLLLGNSETIGDFGNLFSVLDHKWRVYQRKDDVFGTQRLALGRFAPSLPAAHVAHAPGGMRPYREKKLPLRAMTEQALLRQVAPSAALVNDQGDILYLHGRTGLFLEPTPGEADVNNVLRMAREGLHRALSTALHMTVATQETIRRPGLRVKTNGDYTMVDLTVCPAATGLPDGTVTDPPLAPDTQLYLVVLQEASVLDQKWPEHEASRDAAQKSDPHVLDETDPEAKARIAALKHELQAKEDYLQAAIEELETANEELISTNEEMQSMNEELQSTNEELETSKEELQSVNEELATVNAELQTKVADLTRANNDMNNLLAGTGVATLFVDLQLRIVRFTPTATELINLIQADIGRPVGHIVSNLLKYDRLVEDVQAVLADLTPREVFVSTKSGRPFLMRIMPYRTLENVIEGAVLTFVDLTMRQFARPAGSDGEIDEVKTPDGPSAEIDLGDGEEDAV